MTKDRYLELCEQLDKEPVEEEIPIDFEDLPEIARDAISIFNSLGDRVFPEIGYIGKSYDNLFTELLTLYNIDDKEFLIEIITWLDNRAKKKNNEALKRAHDKLKRKSNKG